MSTTASLAPPALAPDIATASNGVADNAPYVLAKEDYPDISNIEIEDPAPMDNIFCGKQMRLLVEPLHTSWRPGRPFWAEANVGVFHTLHRPPIVPDVFLALDVEAPPDQHLRVKEYNTFFVWIMGKAPDVAVEIVSNKKGGEGDWKFEDYARIGVPYYVIFDPLEFISKEPLRSFMRRGKKYEPVDSSCLPEIGLGLTRWQGEFENGQFNWLRWCDAEGKLLPTGREKAEQERQRADQERQRAERLLARLRELGVEEPE